MSGAVTIGRALRFATGLRTFLRDPVEIGPARSSVVNRWRARERAFLENLDKLVWSYPESPHRRLLVDAGVEPHDVRSLVDDGGLPGALEALRDVGVYVSYEEYCGQVEARRGSTSFDFVPGQFANPAVPADYMGSTSGTRSDGTAVGRNFRHLRTVAEADVLHRRIWRSDGEPTAVWLPVLPSSAGLNNVLRLAATGDVPERWFSHVDPAEPGIEMQKRLANRLVPGLSKLFGRQLPTPEHVGAGPPQPVLDWCRDALGRGRRAFLVSYPTSAVALARAAEDGGHRLDGLVMRLGGEPATRAKLRAISEVGAMAANCYAFAQVGRVAMACPWCDDEELHVLEQDVEVVARRRDRGDGTLVDAFLWTTLDPAAPNVLLNVENDDYGILQRGSDACSCDLGQIGMRTRVDRIRGMSKVVTGGITLPVEALEELADEVLPRTIGGAPGDYQFSETDRNGASMLLVRVAPSVGWVDEADVIDVITSFLRRSDLGVLARDVWRGAATIEVVREPPARSRSGKQLVYEPLRV